MGITKTRRFLSKFGLKYKSIMVSICMVLSIVTILAIYFISTQRRLLIDELHNRAASLAKNVAYNCEYPVLLEDIPAIKQIVAGIMSEEDVAFVQIQNVEGKSLIDLTKKGILRRGVEWENIPSVQNTFNLSFSEDSSFLFVSVPIWKPSDELVSLTENPTIAPRSKPIGRATIGFSLNRTKELILSSIKSTLIITVGIAGVGILVALFLVQHLIQPLLSLVKGTREIASGNFSYQVDISRNDELGCLANSFNKMAKELENNKKELDEYSKDLEKKIQERTEALLESEERYRTVLDSSPDPIIIYDMNGKVIYLNPAFTRVFGWTAEEVLGKKIDYVPEESRRETQIMIDKVLAGESFSGIESRRLTKEGDILDVSISGAVYRNRDGIPVGNIINLRDITPQKKLEAHFRQIQKMESIGTIASGVSHNFRNILTAISLNSQLMRVKYADNPELSNIANRIIAEVEKGSRLVADLMQFSRKKPRAEFKILNLVEIIREVYGLISKSFDKKIDIQIDVPELLLVRGDDAGLSQVFMNLCTNARDAMPDGGRLQIKARQKGDKSEVIISDTGYGMDKETLEKCFDPFFTTKEVGKGTGLGLSTAYGIVKDHGGEIHVYSEPKIGTTFKLYFPVVSGGKVSGKQRVESEIVHGKGEKVLIVEDEAEILRSMEYFLEFLGYRVASARSGKEGIDKYKSWKPDAVLLDRNMPQMDGVTCARRIIEYDPVAKIVFISGYEEKGPNGIDESARTLIKAYITKPIDIAELSQVLAQLFE
nr:hybrid sensor histidine kinase/response regulator [Desulfobacterales bacterium]